ncbi:MAG: iron-sulfur cluster assembly protein [Anaerolineales bacterium]|jgi:metal-sulfur cluster biosynthetic enzyme
MPKVSQDPSKQAIWTIESTHPELAEAAEEALREVIDPELGLNVIELGLVRDVDYDEEGTKAHVNMIMTTPFCPYAPALLDMTRSKVEETLNVNTTIEMGMELWDMSFMEEGTGAEWGLF